MNGPIENMQKATIRFTRTTIAYNASDATKNSQCTTEFGSYYIGAQALDVAYNSRSAGMTGGAYNFNVVVDGTQSYRFFSAGNGIDTTTAGAFPVACILKNSLIRMTTGTVAYNASDATKDSQCVTDVGSSYQAAQAVDLAAAIGATLVSSTAIHYYKVAGDATTFYKPTNGNRIATQAGGTYAVVCIHK